MLELKYTIDTDRSASYLDLLLEIDSKEHIRTKLYNKRDDFNFLSSTCIWSIYLSVDTIFQSLWLISEFP